MSFGNFKPGFTIWRSSSTSQGSGRYSKSFADTGQTVSGRLSAMGSLSSNEAIVGAQEISRATYSFSCGGSTDIKPGDEIRHASRPTVTVETLQTTSNGRRTQCRCFVDTTGE